MFLLKLVVLVRLGRLLSLLLLVFASFGSTSFAHTLGGLLGFLVEMVVILG